MFHKMSREKCKLIILFPIYRCMKYFTRVKIDLFYFLSLQKELPCQRMVLTVLQTIIKPIPHFYSVLSKTNHIFKSLSRLKTCGIATDPKVLQRMIPFHYSRKPWVIIQVMESRHFKCYVVTFITELSY